MLGRPPRLERWHVRKKRHTGRSPNCTATSDDPAARSPEIEIELGVGSITKDGLATIGTSAVTAEAGTVTTTVSGKLMS